MAMLSQWLDEPFGAGNGNYDATYWQIVKHPRFLAALHAAVGAYQEAYASQEQALARGIHIMSGSPAQYARVAFLHEMNQDDQDRSGAASAAPAPPPVL